MKLTAIFAVAMVAVLGTTSAQADHRRNELAYVLGGAIVGAAVGELIYDSRRGRYYGHRHYGHRHGHRNYGYGYYDSYRYDHYPRGYRSSRYYYRPRGYARGHRHHRHHRSHRRYRH